LKRALRIVVVNVAVLGLILVVVEGLASYVLLARDVLTTRGLAERRHARYDPDLGWVNEPRVDIPDLYGPGIRFRTNGQGFRNDRDFDATVPPGKYRIICSGDSFTLGYGVDNDHAWCELLTTLDPRLETVNMGQGGYGVDQAYLWYKRDGAALSTHVHLLAFVTEDFRRMQSDEFLGFGKPVLALEHDALAVKNVPVPKRAYNLSWLVQNTDNVRRLRTVDLAHRFAARTHGRGRSETAAPEAEARTRDVLRAIFADLERHHEERGAELALVYLPTLEDLTAAPPEAWLDFVRQSSQALDIPFIDVVSALRASAHEDPASLFLAPGELVYPGAAGHLSDRGNEVVARVILSGMMSDRTLATVLRYDGGKEAP
jgi:hypothetical protein